MVACWWMDRRDTRNVLGGAERARQCTRGERGGGDQGGAEQRTHKSGKRGGGVADEERFGDGEGHGGRRFSEGMRQLGRSEPRAMGAMRSAFGT